MYRRESELMQMQLENNYKQLDNEMYRVNERHEKEMTIQQERYNEMDKKRQEYEISNFK